MYDMRIYGRRPFFFGGPFIGGVLGGLLGSALFPRPFYPGPFNPYYGYGGYPGYPYYW